MTQTSPSRSPRSRLMVYMPAFNEAETIASVLASIPEQLEGIDSIERLVVDDGSTDGTGQIARNSGADVVTHSRNLGVGAAFQTAVEEALRRGVDILLTIDADGQFDPKEIPALLAPLLRGEADLVTGNRLHSERRPEHLSRIKFWGNRQISRLVSWIAQIDIRDSACGFRAYGREALLKLNLIGQFTYTQETILDLSFRGLRVREVPIEVRYFEGRQSRVAGSVWKYGVRSALIILKSFRDYRPLRFFGGGGFAILGLGVAIDGAVALHYLVTGSFTPYKAWGFLGGLLTVFGLLTIMLGLLADMLDRIRRNQEILISYERRRTFHRED